MGTEASLHDWRQGSTLAERMTAELLSLDGYRLIDPQAPLGGPDGGKDLVCYWLSEKCIVAVFFPPTNQQWKAIQSKFSSDYEKAIKNDAARFVFVTNQRLTVTQREELTAQRKGDVKSVDIYHLERLTNLLNSTRGLGIRLDYLKIEMTKEEQVAHWHEWKGAISHSLNHHAKQFEQLRSQLQSHIDEQLSIASAKTQGIARMLVIMLHFIRATRQSFNEMEKTKPYIVRFINNNIINFNVVSHSYKEYVNNDSNLSDLEKATRIQSIETWKQFLDAGKNIFNDELYESDHMQVVFDQVIASLDKDTPLTVDEIQKELEENLIPHLVPNEKAALRMEILSKVLFDTTGMLDRLIDEQLEHDSSLP